MVHVYHLLFAGCLVDSDHTVITLLDPDTPPTIATLEGAYHNINCVCLYIYIYIYIYALFVTRFVVLIIQVSELYSVRTPCPMRCS